MGTSKISNDGDEDTILLLWRGTHSEPTIGT